MTTNANMPSVDIEEGFSTGSDEKKFLSVQDIVTITGISTTAVYELIRTGKIPAVPKLAPLNNKWKPYRVRQEDFEEAVLGDSNAE